MFNTDERVIAVENNELEEYTGKSIKVSFTECKYGKLKMLKTSLGDFKSHAKNILNMYSLLLNVYYILA